MAQWQRMASARESSNQMANGGSRRPKKKNRGTAIEYRAGQQKHRGAAIGDRASLKKNRGVAIEDRAGQKKNRSVAINFHAGQKKSYSAAINARRPKEKLQRGNRVSRRPLGKSRHGNRWIAPASWKITARQSVDRAGHLKICGGGLATISKGGDGLRKWRTESNMEHHLREKHREEL